MDQDQIDGLVWEGPPQMNRERISRLFGFQYITQNVITSRRAERIMNESIARDFGDENEWDRECVCTLGRGREIKCHERSCINRSDYRECPPTCGEGCDNQPFRNSQWKTKLKLVPRHGRGTGIVTMEKIRQGDYVLEFIGAVYMSSENPHRETTVYAIDINRTFGRNRLVIEPTDTGNLGRFLAHSENPNCEVYTYFAGGALHNVIVAIKDFGEDVELTFDYGAKRKQLGIKECLCEYEGCENFEDLVDQLENSARKMFINSRLHPCGHSKHRDAATSPVSSNEPPDGEQPGTSRVVCPEFYENTREPMSQGEKSGKCKKATNVSDSSGQVKSGCSGKDKDTSTQDDKTTSDDSSNEDLFVEVITYRKKKKAVGTSKLQPRMSHTSVKRKRESNEKPKKEASPTRKYRKKDDGSKAASTPVSKKVPTPKAPSKAPPKPRLPLPRPRPSCGTLPSTPKKKSPKHRHGQALPPCSSPTPPPPELGIQNTGQQQTPPHHRSPTPPPLTLTRAVRSPSTDSSTSTIICRFESLVPVQRHARTQTPPATTTNPVRTLSPPRTRAQTRARTAAKTPPPDCASPPTRTSTTPPTPVPPPPSTQQPTRALRPTTARPHRTTCLPILAQPPIPARPPTPACPPRTSPTPTPAQAQQPPRGRGRPPRQVPSASAQPVPKKKGRPRRDPKSLFCQHCDRQFNHKTKFDKHIESILQNRNHKCPHCDKWFLTKDTMLQHKRLHADLSEITRYQCRGCLKEDFKRKADVKTHQEGKRKKCRDKGFIEIKPRDDDTSSEDESPNED